MGRHGLGVVVPTEEMLEAGGDLRITSGSSNTGSKGTRTIIQEAFVVACVRRSRESARGIYERRPTHPAHEHLDCISVGRIPRIGCVEDAPTRALELVPNGCFGCVAREHADAARNRRIVCQGRRDGTAREGGQNV